MSGSKYRLDKLTDEALKAGGPEYAKAAGAITISIAASGLAHWFLGKTAWVELFSWPLYLLFLLGVLRLAASLIPRSLLRFFASSPSSND